MENKSIHYLMLIISTFVGFGGIFGIMYATVKEDFPLLLLGILTTIICFFVVGDIAGRLTINEEFEKIGDFY